MRIPTRNTVSEKNFLHFVNKHNDYKRELGTRFEFCFEKEIYIRNGLRNEYWLYSSPEYETVYQKQRNKFVKLVNEFNKYYTNFDE